VTDIVNEEVLDTDEPELTEYTTETSESVSAEARPARQVSTPSAGTGRRKQAIARVRIVPGTGVWKINGRTLDSYFPNKVHQQLVNDPFKLLELDGAYDVIARIDGGGISGQAGALRHGISRALIGVDENLRTELKRQGFLTRDDRQVERKKAGLKKARKRPQFSKR
jgi:small subunit ribosomal protein S9